MTNLDAHVQSREDLPLTIAFLIALAATLGALFIGEVLGQMPCTLCWYQRIAMFPLVPILGLSIWRGDGMARAYALPLVLAGVVAKLALGLTRHAYLILTPLGIEIFPFFRPAEGMRLVTWQEVAAAEVDEKCTRLTIHHNTEKSSGIHLSLTPIRADRRSLLAKAVIGRLSPGSP